MTEHWLKQPKMLPCCITVECHTMKMNQPPQNFCRYMPSVTGIGMSLDQVQYNYPCLTAFTMTEHWLKQPKMLTSHLHLLSAKNEGAPTTIYLGIKTFPDWCRNAFGSNKRYFSMFNIFYYD